MNNTHLIWNALNSPAARSLVLALIHSLWQGALCVLFLACVLRTLPSRRTTLRYLLSLACLYALPVSVCGTWSWLQLPETAPRAVALESHSDTAHTSLALEPSAITISTADISPATQSGPQADDTAPEAIVEHRSFPFAPWILAGWLAGVCLCLLRSLRQIAAVQKLRRGNPVTEPEVLDILGQVAKRLGARRAVQLIMRTDVFSPFVVGILQPVIVVPASLASGLTLEQWRAILAHELAHVKRWDCLVNLTQLAIESLLFFNPAVWWISRRVRVEREACCDAWAVRCGSAPTNYAALLADVAERILRGSRMPAAAAFAEPRGHSLTERVTRLVAPERAGEVPLRLWTSMLLLTAVLCSLWLVSRATNVAVLAAAQILSDEERVKVLAEDAARINPEQLPQPAEGITLRGRVKAGDGSALPSIVYVTVFTRNQNSSAVSSGKPIRADQSPEFEIKLRPGNSWISFESDDFATAKVGPFGNADARLIENYEVVLKPGVPADVIVQGQDRQPIAGAEVRAAVKGENGTGGRGNLGKGDERGRATLSHVDPELTYSLYIQAPGYQLLNVSNHRFQPGTPSTVTMRPALPVTGVVVDQAGKPIPGAQIFKSRERHAGNSTHDFTIPGQKLVVAAEDGTFKLDQLDSSVIYDLVANAPGWGPVQLTGIEPGITGLRFELAPEITVTGVIRGPAEQLEQLRKNRSVHWTFALDHDSSSQAQLTPAVEGNEARFHIPGLSRGKFALLINGHKIERSLTESIPNLDIDLKDYPARNHGSRKVRIEFISDGVRVAPRGTINLYMSNAPEGDGKFLQMVPVNGEGFVEIECIAPAKISFRELDLVGYWFHSTGGNSEVDIPEGTEAASITVPVLPAGAAKGTILRDDGTPAANVSVYAQYELTTRQFDPLNPRLPGVKTVVSGLNTTTNARGEYFVSPLPLGATFWVRAGYDKFLMLSEERVVTAEAPLPVVDLKFGPAIPAVIRVTDEQGRPLPGQQVRLQYEHPGFKLTGVPEGTDREGQLRYAAINPAFGGQHHLLVSGRDGYQSRVAPLNLVGITEVQLPPGMVIFGRVINANGQPVAGVEVSASTSGADENLWGWRPADRQTNRNGEFRFSNLSPQSYRIFIVGRQGQQQVTAAPASEAQAIDLVVTER